MSMESAAVLGQVLTFLAVIAGFINQYLREARRHRWDVDERKFTAKSLTKHIEENTEISRVAFKEANDVNLKIHALGLDARLRKQQYDDDDGA